jgi:hypothetical protein
MNLNKSLYLLLVFLCCSCINNSKTKTHFSFQKRIINVQEQIKEIEIEDVLINSNNRLYLIEDYLIIRDNNSFEKQIHFFNKNNFEYIVSTAERGQGPYEITIIGHIEYDKTNRKIYVSDHGKRNIFQYDLDSVLADPQHRPTVKMKLEHDLFPDRYQYVNDTLSIGVVIAPIGNSDFKPTVGKWNMNTGEIKLMPYEHPNIKKKRITFAVSMEHGIYVECYIYCDLITICDLNGELKCNIYGRNWSSSNTNTNAISHYGKVAFCNDKIFAAYSGGNNFSDESYPTKFIIFDVYGNYIQTLETGYKIVDFCFDQENNRIIMTLDSEMQFAFLDLNGII